MFGLLLALMWLFIFAALALKWENSGEPKVVKGGKDGPHLSYELAVRPRIRNFLFLAIGVGLAPFWFVFGNNCVLTIPPAHVAAVYDPMRGGIQRETLPEGFHLVMPWWQTQRFSQQTMEYTMTGGRHVGGGPSEETSLGDESIRCQTNEGMNVQIDCTVLFHVDPKDASNLWKRIGEDYVRLIVRPYTHNVLRMVVARYSTVDVYSAKRKEIENEVTAAMRPLFAEKGLVLEQLLVRNVQYGNPAFADAINAKQVVEQQVQTEYQKLNRAKIEKQTIVAEAQGEAQAITKRGATLRENPEVVQYEFVQKAAPRVKSLYLPAGAFPMLTSSTTKGAQ